MKYPPEKVGNAATNCEKLFSIVFKELFIYANYLASAKISKLFNYVRVALEFA